MLKKEKEERSQYELVSVEDMVPQDHLLRKIDSAIDFTLIYDFVEELYCPDNGRPSIDPVVLFKMILIQHIYGIPSLRKTAEELRMNVAYRWFLGYLLNENTPHFSTLSYNFRNRFTPETIDSIFYWILDEINNAGYLSPEAVFVDGTHIKANKALYEQRKETIERVFADAKEKHAMRYTYYRGLFQVTNWVRLKFAAMNLKKFAVHKCMELRFTCIFVYFYKLCALN